MPYVWFYYTTSAYYIDLATLSENYSTTEIDTGFTWIDGKTIYKKTVDLGALPDTATKQVAHGISNLGMVIKIEAIAYSPSDYFWISLPYVTSTANANQVSIQIQQTVISIIAASNRSRYSAAYATLCYTKTS